MIWFTADLHLGHANIMKYCHRPFSSVEEMDHAIMRNMKASIKPGDSLYFLGDLAFKYETAQAFLEGLCNIDIIFIQGNHDSREVLDMAHVLGCEVTPLKTIKIDGQKIVLCHYAMRVWDDSHFNSWQLYGHSHNTLPPIGKQHDVGIDSNAFKPISFEDLKLTMAIKPDNPNFIPPEQRTGNRCEGKTK